VNFQKSTRYALYAAMELARANGGDQVTVARVAERYTIPGAVLAKVFQQLVRAGVAVGTRGTGGGYQLARKASEVTLLEVIDAFEPSGRSGGCLLADTRDDRCELFPDCALKEVIDEVDELVRCTFASITLETLVNRRRPHEEKVEP
jgi:Rrf2 family protein